MTRRPPSHREAGFNLVEMSLVIVMMGLLLGGFSGGTLAYLDTKRQDATKLKLDAIEEAIIRFAAAARRMPCPASAAAKTGQESLASGSCGTQKDGIVPWVTLGLPKEAAVDAWGRYITMRVAPSLSGSTATNSFISTDPTALKTFVAGKGLLVSEINGTTLRDILRPSANPSTGAAYVLISHGKDGIGGISSTASPSGTAETTSETPAEEAEDSEPEVGSTNYQARNANSTALYGTTTAYVMGDITDSFDDYVRAKSVLQVITSAGLLY